MNSIDRKSITDEIKWLEAPTATIYDNQLAAMLRDLLSALESAEAENAALRARVNELEALEDVTLNAAQGLQEEMEAELRLMAQRVAELEGMVLDWWRRRRPLEWSEAQHIADPMANIQVVVFHVNILPGTPKVYILVMNFVKICIEWKPQQNNIK